LADFTTTTSELKFSVHTGSATAQSCLIVNVAFSGVSEFDGSFMTRLYDEHG
jgi:hypothetical protein